VSSPFKVSRENRSSSRVIARSVGSEVPAMAPTPSGSASACDETKAKASASRANIEPYAHSQ
jgi:hypothetical protein